MRRRELPFDPQRASELNGTPLVGGGGMSKVDHVVRDALEALPDRHRTVLEWKFYEQVTDRDLSSRLGLAGHSAAQYRVRKALQALKEELERREREDV